MLLQDIIKLVKRYLDCGISKEEAIEQVLGEYDIPEEVKNKIYKYCEK